MKTDDFAIWARGSGDALRVDEVEIVTPSGVCGGHGTIRCEGERFVLKVTLQGTQQLPKVQGSYTREQFWKITGRIDDKLPFRAEGIAGERSSHFGHYTVEQATFRFDHLSFSTEQIRAADREIETLLDENRKTEREPYRYWGYAFLEGNKPVWCNAGTNIKTVNDFLGDSSHSAADTLKGEFADFEFALIRAGENCEAYFRNRSGSSVSEATFMQTFASFRQAIAFVQGREAWPQHLRVVFGVETFVEEICPHRELPSTPYRLLNDTACANGADLGQAISLATLFFQRRDEISELVQRALYLCRQSSLRVTPLDVGNLSLCAVFEGLVMALHQQLGSSVLTEDARAFEEAKAELLELARRREREGSVMFSRLIGLVSSAKPHRTKDALRWLSEHLNLRWDPEMKEVLNAWQSERHALAHGKEPNEPKLDRMTQQSRLAGGINLIVARLIDYSGLAIYSALEDRYHRLPLVPPTGQVITQEQIDDALDSD